MIFLWFSYSSYGFPMVFLWVFPSRNNTMRCSDPSLDSITKQYLIGSECACMASPENDEYEAKQLYMCVYVYYMYIYIYVSKMYCHT